MSSFTTPNYGLISNMAEGIKQGLLTYQTINNIKHQQQMQELATGVQHDDDGNLSYTPQKQQQLALQSQQTQRSTDKLDPNSQYSVNERQLAKGLLGDKAGAINDQMSASDIDDENGLLGKYMSAQANQVKMQNNNDHFAQGENDKTNNRWSQLGTAVNNASNRTQIGALQTNINKSDTLKQMVSTLPGYKDGMSHEDLTKVLNNASPQQTYEIAKAADQLTSNAQGSVYGTEHLMPNDMALSGSKIHQYLSAGAVPAGQGDILAKYYETAQREGDFYKGARDKAAAGVAAGYKDLKNKDPQRWNEVFSQTTAGGQQSNSAQGLIGGGQSQASPQGQQGAPVPDGRVTVISPDGKIGHIPQAQLDDAIKQGFKVQK